VDKDEIIRLAGKLYHFRKDKWVITGYRCPYCDKHYATLRVEFFAHVPKCKGKVKKIIEDI